MTLSEAKVLMVSSVHRWNDVRIYYKEALSLAKVTNVHLIAVQVPSTPTIPDGLVSVELLPVNSSSQGAGAKSLGLRFRHIGLVMKAALQQRFDVFHFHDPELLPAGWLAKVRGKKVIYDIHEDYPAQILNKQWINKLLRKPLSKLFLIFENTFAKKLDLLITAGPLLNERFKKINPMTEIIHNFPLANELFTKTEWQERKNEICFIGGITRIRGLLEVLKALEKIEDVVLNLAGKYFSQAYREELMKCKGWYKVKEWDWVERDVVAEILSISKIGILTYLPCPNHGDLRATKMFEYMSAGIPVVASNFRAWKNVIEKYNCGICVDPKDPDEIARAIELLLRNDHIANEMGENGRKVIESLFNWENEEKKLVKVYRSFFNEERLLN
ncbi:MAG: glycosyltransferase family 4 protein [Candidatus Neomarinimicrobiota bacterium]